MIDTIFSIVIPVTCIAAIVYSIWSERRNKAPAQPSEHPDEDSAPQPAEPAHPIPAAPAAGHGAGGHATDDHGGSHHHKPGGLIGFGQGLVWVAVGGFLLFGGAILLMKLWGFDDTVPTVRTQARNVQVETPGIVELEPGAWRFFKSGPATKEPIHPLAGYDTIVCNLDIDPKCVDPETTGYHTWCTPWEGGDSVPFDPVICKDHRLLLVSADKPNTEMAYFYVKRKP